MTVANLRPDSDGLYTVTLTSRDNELVRVESLNRAEFLLKADEFVSSSDAVIAAKRKRKPRNWVGRLLTSRA